jgi:quercetin dioxygenase-like cupin family protein
MLNPAMVAYPLSPQGASNNLRVYQVVIQPHSPAHEFDLYSGEEMCFVLRGELVVIAGDETYPLTAGDSIHYDALLPHSWCSLGDQTCEVIWSQASY